MEEGLVTGCRWRQTYRLIHSAYFLVRLVEDNWLRQSSWVHIIAPGNRHMGVTTSVGLVVEKE